MSLSSSPLVPPHSTRIYFSRGIFHVSVTLPRIPVSLINFEPTETKFHVDSMKFTKKYLLEFDFPSKIRVDASSASAELEFGILKCEMKIVDWGELTSQREALMKTKQKFRKNEKKRKNSTEKKEKNSSNEGKITKKRKFEEEKNSNKKQKKIDDEENFEEKKTGKKGKKFLDRSSELAIIENFADKTEAKITEKLTKESMRDKAIEKQREESEAKRIARKSREAEVKARLSNFLKEKIKEKKEKIRDDRERENFINESDKQGENLNKNNNNNSSKKKLKQK